MNEPPQCKRRTQATTEPRKRGWLRSELVFVLLVVGASYFGSYFALREPYSPPSPSGRPPPDLAVPK